MLDEAAERARRTYDAAADHYDDPALAFWSRSGTRTVERLRLPAGAAVLDVPCGSGASAIPAAQAVGPAVRRRRGRLGRAARARARQGGALRSAERHVPRGRHARPRLPGRVVRRGRVGVRDLLRARHAGVVAELWRMVRPGGVLAVTTWGPRPFDPGATALWEAVAEVRPDLVRAFSPWDALVTPGALRDVLRRGGIERSEADAEDGEQAMRGADDWWTVVLGTGYRATIDALSPDHRARVERHVRAAMDGGPPVRTPLVLGTARKPS